MSKRFDVIANEILELRKEINSPFRYSTRSVHHINRRAVHKSSHVFCRHLH